MNINFKMNPFWIILAVLVIGVIILFSVKKIELPDNLITWISGVILIGALLYGASGRIWRK